MRVFAVPLVHIKGRLAKAAAPAPTQDTTPLRRCVSNEGLIAGMASTFHKRIVVRRAIRIRLPAGPGHISRRVAALLASPPAQVSRSRMTSRNRLFTDNACLQEIMSPALDIRIK
jgi:hypothetical protein